MKWCEESVLQTHLDPSAVFGVQAPLEAEDPVMLLESCG